MKDLTYSVRDFQAHLGEALRAARRGEKVRIIARGVPDVVLNKEAPSSPRRESAEERKLRRLEARGKLRLGRGGRIKPFRSLPGGGVSAQIIADRR